MALRDQPYLPLYVMDFVTDEKLEQCSAESTGVYIRLMCYMHKSVPYGTVTLNRKCMDGEDTVKGFAKMLSRPMPYDVAVIERSLRELIEMRVLTLEGDVLLQKRMVKDSEISKKRAVAGSKGGKNVRNGPKKKLYNEPGYVYLLKDTDQEDVYKIGISKEPKKRLSALSNLLKKKLEMVYCEETPDMGTIEDTLLTIYEDHRDGEWISGVPASDIIEQIKRCKLIQSKTIAKQKQNTENEIEYENEIESEDDSENDRASSSSQRSAVEERFDLFWTAYPKKTGKGYARKIFLKIAPGKELFEKMMAALEKAKHCEQWKKDRGQFIPYPSTWLNQERWDDDYGSTPGPGPGQPPQGFDPENPYQGWGEDDG